MCARRTPLGAELLDTLREGRRTPTGTGESARDPVRALARCLRTGNHLAPPGTPGRWPNETALLEALARIDRDPLESERLLGFLPAHRRALALALLSELSARLSAAVAADLRQRRAGGPVAVV